MAYIILRCIILYFVVAIALRIMGKRQIGELQPSELVITLLFSELASVPMQSPELPLITGILPILALASIEIAVSIVTLKNVKFRYMFYGKPIILAYKGKLDQKAMQKARVSIDDLTEAMRTSGIIKIEDIDYAILETNGNMSIIGKENADTSSGMSKIIIVDGRVIKENCGGKNQKWIDKLLKSSGISDPKEVFLLSQDDCGNTHLIKKEVKE